MNDECLPEMCPLCLGPLDERTVNQDGRLLVVFNCIRCFVDWVCADNDVFRAFTPPSTQPINTVGDSDRE